MFYNSSQHKYLLIGLIAFLGIFIVFALRDFSISIIGSVIIYTLFKPAHNYLVKKKGWNSNLSAGILMFLSFIIILVPIFSLTWMLVGKIMEFRNDPSGINAVIEKIDNYMGVKFNKPDLVPETLNKAEKWLIGSFPSAISRIVHILLMVIVMYFILFFMFVNAQYFEKMLLKYAPLPEKNAKQFAVEFTNVTKASVLGHGLIAVSQGILFGFGFFIFGISNPLFWGVMVMLFAFIPLIGPPVVFIPAALMVISSGRTLAGVSLLLYGMILVSGIEYFLRFFISKRIGKIHPIVTGLGLIIGLPFFGVLGLVIGPLIVSSFVLLVGLYENEYAEDESVKPKKVMEVKKRPG